MIFQSARVHEVLQQLDSLEHEVSDWEAQFLDSILRQRRALSDKQYAVVVRMAEQYLDPTVAAELRGQQRLFG